MTSNPAGGHPLNIYMTAATFSLALQATRVSYYICCELCCSELRM